MREVLFRTATDARLGVPLRSTTPRREQRSRGSPPLCVRQNPPSLIKERPQGVQMPSRSLPFFPLARPPLLFPDQASPFGDRHRFVFPSADSTGFLVVANVNGSTRVELCLGQVSAVFSLFRRPRPHGHPRCSTSFLRVPLAQPARYVFVFSFLSFRTSTAAARPFYDLSGLRRASSRAARRDSLLPPARSAPRELELFSLSKQVESTLKAYPKAGRFVIPFLPGSLLASIRRPR